MGWSGKPKPVPIHEHTEEIECNVVETPDGAKLNWTSCHEAWYHSMTRDLHVGQTNTFDRLYNTQPMAEPRRKMRNRMYTTQPQPIARVANRAKTFPQDLTINYTHAAVNASVNDDHAPMNHLRYYAYKLESSCREKENRNGGRLNNFTENTRLQLSMSPVDDFQKYSILCTDPPPDAPITYDVKWRVYDALLTPPTSEIETTYRRSGTRPGGHYRVPIKEPTGNFSQLSLLCGLSSTRFSPT
ncbi:MAG: hypothetical protein Q9183_003640 [Haloplaca sp. 2 TL-2023]